MNSEEQAQVLLKKSARKASPGGKAKLLNIPRNWLHQAFFYMDKGERFVRVFVLLLETILVYLLASFVFSTVNITLLLTIAFLFVYTWNWATNGLFWALIIFTFPKLKNPGAEKTVHYLNQMRIRLAKDDCITGIAIYGSVTREKWHSRSDIDIRFLRKQGFLYTILASWVTMKERFRAFLSKQPMDLFLADNTDFLKKMRSDEIPLLLLCQDKNLQTMYPNCKERSITIRDLLGKQANVSILD